MVQDYHKYFAMYSEQGRKILKEFEWGMTLFDFLCTRITPAAM